MEAHGSITIYTGPMFSGKTQALMARLQSKQRAHKNVLVVKPALDDRYDSVDEIVVKQKTPQRVEKFTANCFQCGQDARFTQKIGGSAGRIEVGADDLYEARCVGCWTPPAQ